MRLIKLLAIFSLVGCAGGPKKPALELCIINTTNQVAYCGTTDGENITKFSDVNYEGLKRMILFASDLETKPLSYLDNAVALTPKNWEPLQNYIDALEIYIKHQCKPK